MSFSGDLYPSTASAVMTTKGDVVRYDSQRERYGIGSTGQVLTVASSLPTWSTLTTADSVLTTQGDILYEGASALARLGFGTSGDVLTTKGTGANPVWETPSAGAWTELADVSDTATDELDSGTLTVPYRFLLVLSYAIGDATEIVFRCNDDANAIYATKRNNDGTTDNHVDQTFMKCNASSDAEYGGFTQLWIDNQTAKQKLIVSSQNILETSGAGTAPRYAYSVSTMNDTSNPITSIQLLNNAGGTFDSARMIVLGTS